MKRAVLISCLLICAGGAFAHYLRYAERLPDRMASFESIPYQAGEFAGEEKRFEAFNYDVLKADTTTLRHYRGAGGETYWLFVAYFKSQKYGSQIHSPKHCLPGGGWRIDRIEPYTLAVEGAPSKEINRLVIAERDNRQLMFYWFKTRGGVIHNEFTLKWDLMKNSLLLRPTDASIIRLTTPLDAGESVDSATRRATAFLAAFGRSIDQSLPFSQ